MKKYFTAKLQATLPMNELIEVLAQKAAKRYNGPLQDWYDQQGTAICFEYWSTAYNRVLNPTKADLELMNCADEDELFDILDDKFCEYC